MKKNILLVILLVLFSIGCSEDEIRKPDTGVIVSTDCVATSFIDSNGNWYNEGYNYTLVEDAQVFVYDDELSFFVGNEPLNSGITDNSGKVLFFIENFTSEIDYFFYAEKGNRNSLRNSFRPIIFTGSIDPVLTRTPTKLQFEIMHDAIPVQEANVILYFSEEAYLNHIPAYSDFNELKESYADLTPLISDGIIDDSQYIDRFKYLFSKKTDSEGIVLFDNLEPKQYWFRITSKDGLSNDGGTISLEEALPDNYNITTSITVGVN